MDLLALELKEICNGLPPWGHVLVWVLVIAFHFFSRSQVKKKVLNSITTDAVTHGGSMSTEIGKSGIMVDYKDGKATLSGMDGGIELTVKTAVLLNPVLDDLSAKVQAGKIDLIKGTQLDNEILLKVIAKIKEEVNK